MASERELYKRKEREEGRYIERDTERYRERYRETERGGCIGRQRDREIEG